MRVRATASSLLIAISLALSAAIPTSAQQQEEWTWKDRDGKVRSQADLDEILKQHKLWLDSQGKSGARADLSGANLSKADLSGADLRAAYLSEADLTGRNLSGANLSEAHMLGAHMRGAYLLGVDLSRANLHEAGLQRATLDRANLRGTDLSKANLSKADLIAADLSAADLSGANLNGTDLNAAHLSGADLSEADLTEAYLRGTELSGADFVFTKLARAIFQPKSLPTLEQTARAGDMELMTYVRNPGPLTQLRKQFQDAGYREQERAITCALNRHNATPSELRASIAEKWNSVRGRPFDEKKIMPFRSFVEGGFKWVAFDLTCNYGFKPGRPLRIVGVLWLLFSFVYAFSIHRRGTSGIYLVGTRWSRGKSNTQAVQLRPRAIRAAKWWKLPFLWLWREWRVLRAAMFFSLMSAFNIGFRDINFGRWLRLLTKREYDLKAVGWARTVSGFQSLLSVYLIALWVLSYFGRPFG